MRKNSRNNAKKERIIMIASSAFVLTALTMTGIYMKSNNEEQLDDGYTLDFTALEDNADEKFQEIAEGNGGKGAILPGGEMYFSQIDEENPGDDLDYMPMEAGSGLVELPGLTDGKQEEQIQENVPAQGNDSVNDAPAKSGSDTSKETEPPAKETEAEQAKGDQNTGAESAGEGQAAEGQSAGEGTNVQAQNSQEPPSDVAAAQVQDDEAAVQSVTEPERVLHFAQSDGLVRPVIGEVLIPFSMNSSVYFSTLDQYKYNSAMMIQAQEDTPVVACAEGRVVEIYQNEEIGNAVTMEIGDGYKVTYGQLKDIRVGLNEYVNRGETFAFIATPTKYFCLEGSNLYLRMTEDGTPVNPEELFR